MRMGMVRTFCHLSVCTIQNCFGNAGLGLNMVLKNYPNWKIRWHTAKERHSKHGLVCGFLMCMGFVDRTKQKIFYPVEDNEHPDIYDGQHHFNSHPALVSTDLFGLIKRFDLTSIGPTHECRLYKESEVFQSPRWAFNGRELVIPDNAFRGRVYTLGSRIRKANGRVCHTNNSLMVTYYHSTFTWGGQSFIYDISFLYLLASGSLRACFGCDNIK